MADTAPAVTNPLAPGLATTEGRLTVAAVIIGTVLEGVGAFLSHEQVTHAGSLGWAAAVAIAGALLQLCTIYGYSKGRTLLKQQALLTGLTAALPLATSIAEAVFDKLAGKGSVDATLEAKAGTVPPPVPPVVPSVGVQSASIKTGAASPR